MSSDQPAPLTTEQPSNPLELRAAALDALQALGADYLTAARAVSRVLHAVEAERRMSSAHATPSSPTWDWLQRIGSPHAAPTGTETR